ncbi:hypothetical protein GCM10010965_26730 [Caldalkalibacillus thermarum]|uniref:histidine phosphatase family protein n=1 Tax=Caldalkalibacillus thermarum TaxID=296745 RepID=UPI00166D051A|nr:histidine phosphatase family protein [Caldalkalibacillus thermarum]GGK32475.1 hypothetical protein GCM10010965_26730 [Caldalkalibacillus thermarum]
MGTVYAVHLYLVRHGVTEWNRQGRYYGQTDLPCLPHMWHLFDGLKSRLAGLVFDQVYSSDLTRCRQTLDYLAPSVAKSACYDHRLREYHFGAWEGRTHSDLEQDHLYQAWLNDMESVAPSGGEKWAQFKGRIDQWLSEVLTTSGQKAEQSHLAPGESVRGYPDSLQVPTAAQHCPVRILTVTHGGVIRYLLSQWGVTSSMWEAPIHTGQAYVLELSREKGGWRCTASWVEPSPASGPLSGHAHKARS